MRDFDDGKMRIGFAVSAVAAVIVATIGFTSMAKER